MKRRLTGTFLVIVLAPLALVSWLAVRHAQEGRIRARENVRELAQANLGGLEETLGEVWQEIEAELGARLHEVEPVPEPLRDLGRRLPQARQLFLLDATTGVLLYPALGDALTESEEEFLRRTRDLWTQGDLLDAGGSGDAQQEAAGRDVPSAQGYQTWYHGRGVHLIVWWRVDGRVIGAELDRTNLLSRLIGALPDTDPTAPGLGGGCMRLTDSTGQTIYHWGRPEEASDEVIVSRALRPPLGFWSLQYLAPPASSGLATAWPALSGSLALVLVVALLAFYFYRESSREMVEAQQRVTFVNQVSHELKTPLTNVRMYAELLQEELEDQPPLTGYVDVIVGESQRLSRLIQNVLTFGRGTRKELRLNHQWGVVDETVSAVVERFRPALSAAEVTPELHLEAPSRRRFDPDVVEQVVGNLLSNVEKYASAGGWVEVRSGESGDEVTITVSDRGPGIRPADRERVFEPFRRLSGELTEGISGSGIGLTIARQLARLHGGDLRVVDETRGAAFQLTIHATKGDSP